MNFNGSNQYVEVPYSAALNTSVFTIEIWTKVNSSGNYHSPMANRASGAGYNFYKSPSDVWEYWNYGGGGVTTGPAVTIGQWYHLAATYDGTTHKFYVDGVLASSVTASFTPNPNRNFRIGAGATETSAQYFLNGAVDELRFWNVARTQAEIQANKDVGLSAQTNLVAYYNFDQTSGALQDQSGNGHHGTSYGGPTYGTSGVTVTSACSIVDQALTATDASVCSGSGTSITTASSETGVSYSLYEATGNTVVDGPTSGTGSALPFNTGNLTTATDFYVKGDNSATENSLDFDGSNDNVAIPHNTAMNAGSAFTVEAWVYRRSNGHQTAVSKWDDDSNQRGWMLNFGEHTSTSMSFLATASGAWSSPLHWNTTLNVPLNEWHHVAITFISTGTNNVKCYYDGVLHSQTTKNISIHPTNIANTFIGGYDDVNNGLNGGANIRMFDGKIDEVRIWNAARTASELLNNKDATLSGSESGLAAYYNFNEGSGTTASDQTSNGFNGTLTNMDPNTDWTTGAITATTGCSVQSASNVSVGISTIVDQALTATDTEVCAGSGTTVTTASSESGVNYTLYDAANTLID
jgi:hypothetical protein